ncbi:MAG: hypothetical protein EB127_28220 [Alphaproteobacteria bacterium]|nr:hypothetical protein [Alphaproteobacteria bacterium]
MNDYVSIKTRLSNLLRATFLGFIIVCILLYLKPELSNSLVIIYGLLAGKNALETHVTSKTTDGKPK